MGNFDVTFTAIDGSGVIGGASVTVKVPHFEGESLVTLCKRAFTMYAAGVDNHREAPHTGLDIELNEYDMIATITREDPFSQVYYLTEARLHVCAKPWPTAFDEKLISSGLVSRQQLCG